MKFRETSVAVIVPVGNGAALREFLAAHRVDDDYTEDVLSGCGGTTDELGTA